MTLRTPTYLLSSPLNSPPVSHIGDDDVPYPRASCDGDTQQTAAADDDEERCRMADYEDLDWWEENYNSTDPELILKPVSAGLSLLSLASCGVMATVMLRSSLRRASWTPYMLLWTAAEVPLMLMFVVEGVFVKLPEDDDSARGRRNVAQHLQFDPGGNPRMFSTTATPVNRSHDASFSGCLVYYFVDYSAAFLSTTSVMALSLDLLLRGLKPSLFGPRCSLHVTLALLVCGLLLYCPIFFIIEARFHHSQVNMCLSYDMLSSAANKVYLYGWLFLVDVPWPVLVCVGLVVLWWKRRQFSEHLRILAAFLLGFLILGLPQALSETFWLVSLFYFIENFRVYLYEILILQYVARVCSFVKPLVILGCLSTSSDFRRATKDSFRRPFYWVVRNNPGFMTVMTEVEGDT